MTDEDIARLRALAQAATPGPWKYTRNICAGFGGPTRGDEVLHVSWPGGRRAGGLLTREVCHWPFEEDHKADAQYIAAASPDVVLALLDEIERLRGER